MNEPPPADVADFGKMVPHPAAVNELDRLAGEDGPNQRTPPDRPRFIN